MYGVKEAYLRHCIDSLLNQGRKDYKIILVDDGSPDKYGEICDKYAVKTEIITAIYQKNSGVSTERNNGIKTITTKWLTFIDADDWVENTYISKLYTQLNDSACDTDIPMFGYSREYKTSGLTESLREDILSR